MKKKQWKIYFKILLDNSKKIAKKYKKELKNSKSFTDFIYSKVFFKPID